VTRRAGFLAGLVASALAALPAALRFESALVWQAYIVCVAGCALIMAPLSAALAGPSKTNRFTLALTVGALFASLPLLPFAVILKTATHHRPLGGVTFAVIAGVAIVGSSLISGRLATWAGAQHSALGSTARYVLIALSVLGTTAVLLGLVQTLGGGDAYRTAVFDAIRILGLSTLAARVRLPDRLLGRVRGFGLAAWIAVVTVGVCLARAPVMQAELGLRCPILHWPLVWLGD
jgi:hypothetical protein